MEMPCRARGDLRGHAGLAAQLQKPERPMVIVTPTEERARTLQLALSMTLSAEDLDPCPGMAP